MRKCLKCNCMNPKGSKSCSQCGALFFGPATVLNTYRYDKTTLILLSILKYLCLGGTLYFCYDFLNIIIYNLNESFSSILFVFIVTLIGELHWIVILYVIYKYLDLVIKNSDNPNSIDINKVKRD